MLSSDYAFREAIATGDSGTIASVMWNHGKRTDADMMMLVGLDGRVIADVEQDRTGKPFRSRACWRTRRSAARDRDHRRARPPPRARDGAGAGGQARGMGRRRLQRRRHSEGPEPPDRPPHLVPEPARRRWWRVQASTLAAPQREAIVGEFAANRFSATDAEGNSAVRRRCRHPRAVAVYAHGQRPRGRGAAASRSTRRSSHFRNLQLLVLASLIAVFVSILASLLIARGIARPMGELADVAPDRRR